MCRVSTKQISFISPFFFSFFSFGVFQNFWLSEIIKRNMFSCHDFLIETLTFYFIQARYMCFRFVFFLTETFMLYEGGSI